MSKCLECGYYDKEKHYCPFYCQLIRETLNEAISFELVKIKKKIKNDCVLHEEWFADMYDLETLLIDIDEIFDIEISELKGESNAE